MSTSLRMREKEVCEALSCSRAYLYALDKRGLLKRYRESYKYCFWIRSEVEAFAVGRNPYANKEEQATAQAVQHA